MAASRELTAYAFVERVELLARLDDVTSAMQEALAPFGIDSFIVTGLPTKWQPFEELVMASRWPVEFLMLYIENDYARVDPLSRRSILSRMPFEWDAASYRTDPDPLVVELMQLAAQFHMRHGFLIPIHGPNGEEGCVSTAAADLHLSARAKAAVHMISLYAFERMRSLRKLLPADTFPADAARARGADLGGARQIGFADQPRAQHFQAYGRRAYADCDPQAWRRQPHRGGSDSVARSHHRSIDFGCDFREFHTRRFPRGSSVRALCRYTFATILPRYM